MLDDNFGRHFNANSGYRDRIHLGRLGISRLGLLIRDAVLRPRYSVDFRSFAGVAGSHVHGNHHLSAT